MRISDRKYAIGDNILADKPEPKPRKNYKLMVMLKNRRRGFGKPRNSVVLQKSKKLEESLKFAYPDTSEPKKQFKHKVIDLERVKRALDQDDLLQRLNKSLKKDTKF